MNNYDQFMALARNAYASREALARAYFDNPQSDQAALELCGFDPDLVIAHLTMRDVTRFYDQRWKSMRRLTCRVERGCRWPGDAPAYAKYRFYMEALSSAKNKIYDRAVASPATTPVIPLPYELDWWPM